jgi:hypothetical protein
MITPIRVTILLSALLGMFLLLLAVGGAAAQVVRSPFDERPAVADRAVPLPDTHARWFEPSYGLSFQPPPRSRELQNTRDGALVVFALPERFRIAVHLHDLEQAITLRDAADLTRQQFVSASPSAREVAPPEEAIKPAGRPTLRLGFYVPANGDKPAWVADLVLMKLDPTRFIIFQADLEAADFSPATRRVFHDLLRSVEVASLDAIDQSRLQLVETADQWRRGLDFDAIWQRLPEQLWFRVIREGQDVGLRKLTFRKGSASGRPGYTLVVLSREVRDELVTETEAKFFLAQSRDEEIWSLNTVAERVDPDALPRVRVERGEGGPIEAVPVHASKEWSTLTGFQSGEEVTVVRDSAEHDLQKTWPTPPVGYFSQLEAEVLPMLLLDGRPTRLQAYAYHHDSRGQDLALRTEIATQAENGTWSINTRAATNSGWRRYLFNEHGQLLQITLADGTLLIPATAEQVQDLHGS